MDIFSYICIIVIITCSIIIWMVPLLLSWIFAIKYQIKLTIGMISLPYLKLKDVRVTNKGVSLDIDEIGISSSLFNSDVTKLLALIFKDVRINRLVPLSRKNEKVVQRKEFSLEQIRIPNILSSILQFTLLQLVNISIIWADSNGWLIHTTSTDFKLEGHSTPTSREIVLSITTSQTKTRIRRRTSENIDYAEFNFSITATTTIPNFCSDKFHIFLQRPRCILNENFLQMVIKNNESTSNTHHSSNIVDIRNFIPKNFVLSIEDTEIITNFSEDSVITSSFKSCKINARRIQETTLSFYLAFKLDDMKIMSTDTKLFFLKNISLDAKLQKDIVNIYIVLNTVHAVLTKNQWPNLSIQKEKSFKSKNNNILNKWNIECCLELWSISGRVGNNSMMSCGHSKIVVQRSIGQWNAELLLESLGWTLVGLSSLNRKNHVIGTPLYLAVALIKICHLKNNAKIDAMLDVLRIEWNDHLVEMLQKYQLNQTKSLAASDNSKMNIIPKMFLINLDLSNFNLFFHFQNTTNVAVRLDSLLLEGNELKFKMQMVGFKMVDMNLGVSEFLCCRSKDMSQECLGFFKSQVDIQIHEKRITEWNLNVFNSMEVHWSHELHMKLLTIFRSFAQSNKTNSDADKSKITKWSAQFGKLNVFAILGKHTLQSDITHALIGGSKLELDFALTKIIIDNVLMGVGTALKLSQSDCHPELREEREEAEDLETLINNSWIFNLEVLEIRFPYIHQFYDAIQNELITTVKWLKIVHNKKKVPFTADSPLPRDLLIKINKCLFEMSDDPFEVKLRDNYELLVDEYKESLKRQQMLDKKITELRSTHLLLPAGKVDDLYANLRKKNAEIYIQRSKQITGANPQRTRLLAWELQGLSIIALADKSYHGKELVLETMQKLDPNSPFPAEGLVCSTLWCRVISVYLNQCAVSLRDFPQKFLECRGLHLWGCLVGAEAAPTARSIRHVDVQLTKPWGSMTVERSMTQLKFYHDLNLKMEHYSYAFGPCWEPVLAQCNLSLEQIFAPSRDPSPPLPFWDKCRLLFHGRLTMVVQYMTVLLHASLDPYNTTEEMQITWNELALDWVDGKIKMNGDLDVYVRTASKYDDCRLLHLPNVKLTLKIDWVCFADPNDHHAIIPYAPDKLPEYSSNQVHDSYRAFRSQNVDMNMHLEAKGKTTDISLLLLYGSTLRWFENLKFILSGVTRPTRRGVIFGTTKPRRKPLSRHYRRVGILLSLHRFQVSYWMSFTMQNGCEIIGNRVVCSAEHNLTLTPLKDNLKRRPRAIWSITYMNCEVTETQIWLKSALQSDDYQEELPPSVEKYYCLSVGRVSYGRETPYANSKDTPTHRLVVDDLKGAWTKNNRDIAFALFDAYVKSQQLRKNLSADALKVATHQRNEKHEDTTIDNMESMSSSDGISGHQQSPASMLQQLIAEADHKAVVFSDDQSPSGRQTRLQGYQACQLDDVLHKNWLIELVNSQVVLRGCSTKGYVILSAAKAQILQRIHEPESKKTWVGSLECLQYFATVGADDEDIMWLPVEYIQERCGAGAGPAAVVGSGRAAGGVVSEVVGASGRQIQRIVSRCRCEFFYVSYGSLEPTGPSSDAFTLMHHDLDVCTNSLQYAMLLDIVNSLLLWTEPNRKEAAARLARLRFQLQLRSDRSIRVPVQKLQTQVRGLLGALRQLERDAYLAGSSSGVATRMSEQLTELKAELSARSEELDMLLAIHRGSAPHTTVRAHEIYFKHAQWRLTEADGQLGIADLVLSNFLYTKNATGDDSVEHLLELGYIHMTNLLPNQVYTEVLSPTEIQRDMPVDHKHVLRIFCRERPPVGGISVKEHFEINVVPITIGLTKKFYNTLLKFCFPERDDPDSMQSKVSKDTSFYVRIDQKDDVEKMKERAEKNKLFIYIKIPEVPVRVSYKGNKEKNIEDVRDFSLVIPTLEYHNVTWTWLDLLLAMKSDTRKVILSQAIKQKLQIHRSRGNSVDNNAPLEEDKARMLLGKLSLQK